MTWKESDLQVMETVLLNTYNVKITEWVVSLPGLDSPDLAETLCGACPLLHGFSSPRGFLYALYAHRSSHGNSYWSRRGDREGWNSTSLRRMRTDAEPRISCCLKMTWRGPGVRRYGVSSAPGCQSAHFFFLFLKKNTTQWFFLSFRCVNEVGTNNIYYQQWDYSLGLTWEQSTVALVGLCKLQTHFPQSHLTLTEIYFWTLPFLSLTSRSDSGL